MVFNFLKKKAVRFEKDEEVEVLLLSRQDLFITRIARQSFQSIFLYLPPLARKKKLIEPDVSVIVHFTRRELLGSFRATVIEVFSDEHPPLFAIDIPREISWEEIVPSRLVERNPACLSSAPRSLLVRHDGREVEGTFFCFEGETLTFHSPGDFAPGARLCLVLTLEKDVVECEAVVLRSTAAEDRGLFETAVSMTSLTDEVKEHLKRFEPGKREE